MTRLLPMLCLLATAACAPTAAETAAEADRAAEGQAQLAAELRGYVPDGTQDCLSGIDRRVSDGSRVVGDRIVYRIGGRRAVNDMLGQCALRRDVILVTQTPTSQLCRGDIVQLVDRSSRFPVGNCAYGSFQMYKRAPQ